MPPPHFLTCWGGCQTFLKTILQIYCVFLWKLFLDGYFNNILLVKCYIPYPLCILKMTNLAMGKESSGLYVRTIQRTVSLGASAFECAVILRSVSFIVIVGGSWLSGRVSAHSVVGWISCPSWTHWTIFHSSQFSTTGLIEAVICKRSFAANWRSCPWSGGSCSLCCVGCHN